MTEITPMSKSQMLRASLRCHALGWWGLVPVLGLVPALLAFLEFRAVMLGNGHRWNAARRQLLLGVWLASAGVLLSLAVLAVVVIAALDTWG